MADLSRGRQRVAGARLQGEGSRHVGRSRSGFAGRRTARPRAAGRRGIRPVDDPPAAITLAMLARSGTCWTRRPWFAHGFASYRKHFAATIALEISGRNACDAALQKLGSAPFRPRSDPPAAGRRHGRCPRRRQRVAGARLQRKGSRSAGDAHRPQRGLAGRLSPRPRAPGRRGVGAAEDPVEQRGTIDASPVRPPPIAAKYASVAFSCSWHSGQISRWSSSCSDSEPGSDWLAYRSSVSSETCGTNSLVLYFSVKWGGRVRFRRHATTPRDRTPQTPLQNR